MGYDYIVHEQLSRGQRLRRVWRRAMGEPAAIALFGPADLGPGRNASPEQWARYREQQRNPRPKVDASPPPGYRFVWYTDGQGMRHRAAVRADRSED